MDDLVQRLREGVFGTDISKDDVYLTGLMHSAVTRIEDLESQVKLLLTPIGMQDVRLMAGEGKLAAHTILEAVNAIIRSRKR